ncbi:MAG: radical SAM protein [Candidatus Micrarchaeota archaeon]|nr:radical SAM protein [Candidatus Micrarchaeota archaeon]
MTKQQLVFAIPGSTGPIPKGIGAVLRGWDVKEDHFRNPNYLPIVDFRAMTEKCRHNCFHCFTKDDARPVRKTLTLPEILSIIDQLAEMRTWAINYLGEGEPTLDKDFFRIVEYTVAKSIHPVVFTDAATRLRDRDFVRRLYATGASVCPKCDSLWDAEYQNWVVGDKSGRYFAQRNEAITLLTEEGFNAVSADGTTRLGFDMIVCRRNAHEIERTLRYCRENNLWIIFSFFLPTGRSGRENFDKSLMLSTDEKRRMQELVRRVDAEYGFHHDTLNNFMTYRCLEFMCIYGDGRVSPCVGNEDIIGNVKADTIRDLRRRILEKYPCHDPATFDGNCCYRSIN